MRVSSTKNHKKGLSSSDPLRIDDRQKNTLNKLCLYSELRRSI